MSSSGKSFGVRLLLGLYLVLGLILGVTEAQAQPLLTRHVRETVLNKENSFLKTMSPTRVLRLDLVLPIRDQTGLDNFLEELYDPSSPSYRHFLTVSEFTSKFGPSQEDYDAVINFATTNGFNVVGGSRDGMDVQIEGSVASIESAFHVTMGVYYDTKDKRSFYAPNEEPSIDLPFQLWHISGLDNYSIPHPRYTHRNPTAIPNATTGSGPSSSFLGSDMRAAYYGETGATALTGAGQNLGLFEYSGTDLADLTTYYKNIGQTNKVPVTLLSTDGTSTSCVAPSCDDTEQTLDITQALGMAPGLASMVVYVGSTDTAILSSMTSHNPLPATIGCSWGWTPADPSTLNPYWQKMAAQGQTFFAAAGDSSTWSSTNEAWPADAAYVVSVGGTDLTTHSPGGAWASETAWASSGGGISPDGIAIPSWQQLAGVINSSNKGSLTLRNGPDVAANANNTFYVCANQTTCTANEYGGTSFAAPMWAAYIALANQQSIANGGKLLGFINPSIYSIGVSSNYNTNFHDIISGTSGSYQAVVGYDLVTGWGSMNGSALINALAPATTSGYSISSSQSSLTISVGNSATATITNTVNGGFNSVVTLSATGLPAGVTATFNPNSITGNGTSTLSLSVGASTAPGTYSISINGTSGSLLKSATITLTVTGTAAGNFYISASPSLLGVVAGNSTTTTVTSQVFGQFGSPVTLSTTGLPPGITVSFNPSSITGAGHTVMTLSTTTATIKGLYLITISATGGGITNTTEAFVFVY